MVDYNALQPTFVGREETLGAVLEALNAGPALVLIEGEAGIGKTRLVGELLSREPTARRVPLVMTCPPLTDPHPLGVVVTGIRRMRPDYFSLGLSPLCGALRPHFPDWAAGLPPALEALNDPKETRHRLFSALAELVGRLGVDILVLEDAHWSDPATLEWLLMLTASATPATQSPSVILTYRPTDVPTESLLPRLTSRLPAGMRQVRVALPPLSVEQVRRLVGSMLDTDDVSSEFATFLHERTDGLPLAVEETVRLLRERHHIVRRGSGWTRRALDQLDVPPTVRDSVLERVSRLPPAARRILQAAAILSEPADEGILISVAAVDEQVGRQGIGQALVAGLLREADGNSLVFRHMLDAKAVEGAIPASDRWQLHATAAAALHGLDPTPVVRLARHYREANDREAWCRYGEASADLAWESGDDRMTVATLLDLLRSLDHPLERRSRLARKLGRAAFYGFVALSDLVEWDVAAILRDVLASDDVDPGERGELRLLLGRMLWVTGDLSDAFTEFEGAIPDLGHRPGLALRAMANLALPLMPDWPAERHLQWLERATTFLPRVHAHTDRLMFAMTRATALLLLGEDEGWSAAAELTSPPPPSDIDMPEQRLVVSGLQNIGRAATVWGRYGEARRYLSIAAEVAEATASERYRNSLQTALSYLSWYTGEWEHLESVVAKLAETEESDFTDQLELRQLLGLLDAARGVHNSATERLDNVAAGFLRLGVISTVAPAALARLHLLGGESAAALARTRPTLDMIERKGVWFWASDLVPVHVEALLGVRSFTAAADVANAFVAGIRDRTAPAATAAAILCQAILAEASGEHAGAATMFGRAASAWSTLPRPYEEFLARERQGQCLLVSGHTECGLRMLTQVEQQLSQLGARWDADRVAHVLRQHGIDVTRNWRRGRKGYGDELSPRELDVVRLVARGLTNKQIAAQLFISPRTVDRHLSAAMRKLEASTRTAAATAAAEAGLLPTAESP